MVLIVNKYHRTAAGEAVSTEKIEKADEQECTRKAMARFFQYLTNYSDDTSVLAYSVSVTDPKTCRMVDSKVFAYTEPVETTESE